MFRFIGNFFTGSWDRIQLTVEQTRWALFIVSVLTFIGVLPAFFGAPILFSVWFSLPFWLFSAYRIFGIWRYFHIAVAGEIVDAVSSIGSEENETIWDSKIAGYYRKALVNIWLFQTVIFLGAPLYFNFTSGGRLWLSILIMVFGAIAMASSKVGILVFRSASMIVMAMFVLLGAYSLFPQVEAIPVVSKAAVHLKAGKIYGENVRERGDIDALREKQRQEMVSVALEKARKWQKQEVNKGKEIPESIRIEIDAAYQGKTAFEYIEEARVEMNKHLKTSSERVPEVMERETKLTKKVINGQDVWAIDYYPDQKPSPGWIGPSGLPAGNYEITVLEDREGGLRGRINNEKDFSVRNGRVVNIPENSSVSFYTEKGGLIGIFVKRVG